MSNVLYNQRTWLNPEDCHFTGSMVCFDGKDVLNQGKLLPRYTFVEVASCHGKVRIHSDANSDMNALVAKLKSMRNQLNLFIDHFERTEATDQERRAEQLKILEQLGEAVYGDQ